MIYQLNDAIVTVTIKLDQAPRNTTFITVTADFQGIYGLAQDQTTIECKSTGALEDSILALAGAPMPGTQGAATSTAGTLRISSEQDLLGAQIAAADEHAAATATAFPDFRELLRGVICSPFLT